MFRGCHILSPCHFSCCCLVVTCFFFKYVPSNLFLAPSSVYVSCTPNKEFRKKCKVYYQTDRGKEKLIAEILWGDRSRQRTARRLIRLWDDPLFTDVATTTTKTTKNTPHWNCHLDFMRTLHPMKLLRPILPSCMEATLVKLLHFDDNYLILSMFPLSSGSLFQCMW